MSGMRKSDDEFAEMQAAYRQMNEEDLAILDAGLQALRSGAVRLPIPEDLLDELCSFPASWAVQGEPPFSMWDPVK
ncbi:hypothetical protein JCM10449v2_005955 [Rhodotorula kratochvilovae]